MKTEFLFDGEAPHLTTNARRTARQHRAGRILVQYSFFIKKIIGQNLPVDSTPSRYPLGVPIKEGAG